MTKKFRIPKTVASAKIVCKKLCDEHHIGISVAQGAGGSDR